MKILHIVENYSPSVGGMQEVVKQLSERMANSGHEVTVVCSAHPLRKTDIIKGVKIKTFHLSGSFVQGIKGDASEYESYLLQQENDIVVFFAAQIWSTDIALPILDKIKGKKIFVPTGFSALTQPAYRAYYDQMKTWMKSFDMNVFLSEDYRDILFAKENGVDKRMIIPNAADEREFENIQQGIFRKQYGINEDRFLILHVGSFTGLKGHLEAVQMLNKISTKNVTMCFIGNDYEAFPKYKRTKLKWIWELLKLKLSSKRLLIFPPDRQRTLAAFADADLFLFPSNVECSPLVLFEAVASETPFLSAEVGNAKEIAQWTEAGWIIPTSVDENGFSHVNIEQGAKLLDEMLQKEDLRKQLAQAGKKHWREKFTWEKITESYLSLYNQLIAAK